MTMSPVEEQMEISLGEVSEAHLPPSHTLLARWPLLALTRARLDLLATGSKASGRLAVSACVRPPPSPAEVCQDQSSSGQVPEVPGCRASYVQGQGVAEASLAHTAGAASGGWGAAGCPLLRPGLGSGQEVLAVQGRAWDQCPCGQGDVPAPHSEAAAGRAVGGSSQDGA